jgi:phospholipid/cholesterol/gamma-HCH transport system substrate-binding protein
MAPRKPPSERKTRGPRSERKARKPLSERKARKPPSERKARKPLSERNPIAIALAGLAILAGIALLAFFANDLPIIGGGTTYTAYFTEAAGLQSGAEVAVAGVPVGRVTGVSLAGDRVLVSFTVKNAWIGDASTVDIDIKTILGDKYLAVNPAGGAAQNPGQTIPASRTHAPYDVTQAFNGLGTELGQINTTQLARSLQTIATTFKNASPGVRSSLRGLADLSRAIAAKNVEVTRLLAGTRKVTGDLSGEDANFSVLFRDGNLLLAELRQCQAAIHALLLGTQALATQLSGLVNDDSATLGPALSSLSQVTAALQANQASLARALALAGPYYRLLGNTLGNGRWFDAYLCGLVPRSYLPPRDRPARGCVPPKSAGGRR